MAIACFCDHCGAENTPGDTICCACQQPLTPHADISGTLLNQRYELLTEVGAGGFGAVYKARDTRENDRLVAVKQINLQGLSSQEIIEATDAFNREAEILSTLSHPLLPTIFDRFSDPDHWYLVMTYIDGSTLDDYLQHHQVSGLHTTAGLPLGETLEIALRLCDALHYLHSQQPPVIFRDLKPGNIMRTRKGQLYLIDFGIARRFKPGQAKDTIPFGSPGFAAPEQYGRAQTTPQADIYSLGALLYCLLTGDDPSEHPFDFAPLPYPNAEGMRELNALTQRMVALDPRQRPADILEVQADLKGIRHLSAWSNQQSRLWIPPQSQTPPPTDSGQQHVFLNPTQQQKRKVSRRVVITAGLIVGGVALAIGTPAWTMWQSTGQTNTSDANWGNAYQPIGNSQDQNTYTPAPTASPTFWSPDLSHTAVVNADNSSIDLYIDQGQNFLNSIQPPDFSPDMTVQWSPNNNQIILFLPDGYGEVWDVQSQNKLFALVSTTVGLPLVVWSPDAKHLATAHMDNNNQWIVNVLETNNGTSVLEQTALQQGATCLGWSPDSRYFIFPKQDNATWTLEIWDILASQRVQVISDPNNPAFDPGSVILAVSWSPLNHQIAFVLQGAEGTAIWFSPLNNLTGTATPQLALQWERVATALNSTFLWSPDEKYLGWLINDTLTIWDVTNRQVALTSDGTYLIAFAWSADSQSVITIDTRNNPSTLALPTN